MAGLSFTINRGGVNRGPETLVIGGPSQIVAVAILAPVLPVPSMRYTFVVQTIPTPPVPVPLFYDPTLFDVEFTACRDPTYTMTPTPGERGVSLIATVVKEPAERVQAGVDYSCWLRGPGRLVALQIDIEGFLADEPLPTLRLFGAYIAPTGKVAHILVEDGTDGHDYSLTVRARGSDGRIKEDQMVVRVEEPA